MPKQLPQLAILWSRYPYSRKTIFPQQLQQKLRILAVGFLPPDALGLDLRGIANPHLDTQFRQQSLYASDNVDIVWKYRNELDERDRGLSNSSE